MRLVLFYSKRSNIPIYEFCHCTVDKLKQRFKLDKFFFDVSRQAEGGLMQLKKEQQEIFDYLKEHKIIRSVIQHCRESNKYYTASIDGIAEMIGELRKSELRSILKQEFVQSSQKEGMIKIAQFKQVSEFILFFNKLEEYFTSKNIIDVDIEPMLDASSAKTKKEILSFRKAIIDNPNSLGIFDIDDLEYFSTLNAHDIFPHDTIFIYPFLSIKTDRYDPVFFADCQQYKDFADLAQKSGESYIAFDATIMDDKVFIKNIIERIEKVVIKRQPEVGKKSNICDIDELECKQNVKAQEKERKSVKMREQKQDENSIDVLQADTDQLFTKKNVIMNKMERSI